MMLDLLQNAITAIGSAKPPEHHQRRGRFDTPDGNVGAFWSIEVPYAKLGIEALFRFAETKRIDCEVMGQKATIVVDKPLMLEADGVAVVGVATVGKLHYSKSLHLPYPTHEIGTLAQGGQARFGHVALQCMGSPIPEVTLIDSGNTVKLAWAKPIQLSVDRGAWHPFAVQVQISELHITREGGTLISTGVISNAILPSLTWGDVPYQEQEPGATDDAQELLEAVQREKPRGWKRLTKRHAQRIVEQSAKVGASGDAESVAEAVAAEERPVGFLGISLGMIGWWALSSALQWAAKWWWNRRQSRGQK